MFPFIKPVAEGMIGAVAYLSFRLWKNEYEYTEKLKLRIPTRITLGGITGYIWFAQGFPNSFNTIMAGALAPELIEGFIEKWGNKVKTISE